MGGPLPWGASWDSFVAVPEQGQGAPCQQGTGTAAVRRRDPQTPLDLGDGSVLGELAASPSTGSPGATVRVLLAPSGDPSLT